MRHQLIGDPPRDVPNDLPRGAAGVLARVSKLREQVRRRLVSEYGEGFTGQDDVYGDFHQRLSEAFGDVDGYLGAGIGRVAFLLPKDVVLKVALVDASRPMNLSEARIWSRAQSEDARHLLPVLAVAADGWWVAMPYCETGVKLGKIGRPVIERMYALVDRGDVFSPDNWCHYQGRLVLLDYGQD